MLLSYDIGACPKEETMMLTFPTWVVWRFQPWLQGRWIEPQVGLSMMEVTKLMKKTTPRLSFDEFLCFQWSLIICTTCNLITLTFFIICLSDISYQERSFTNLCSFTNADVRSASHITPTTLPTWTRLPSSRRWNPWPLGYLGPMGAVFCAY